MQYVIEVDDDLNITLIGNAKKHNISIEELIEETVKRYVIDEHIMEQSELWQKGIDECAAINLDWANL